MSDSTCDGAASGRPSAFSASQDAVAEVPSDGPDATDGAAATQLTCACGHDRRHYLVSPVPTYTGWAKFWVIFMGVSTKPSRVDFQCRQCHQTFDFTEDPSELGAYL
jgi:hypothetical protein